MSTGLKMTEFPARVNVGLQGLGDSQVDADFVVEQYENGILLLRENEAFGVFMTYEQIKEILHQCLETETQGFSPELEECFELSSRNLEKNV